MQWHSSFWNEQENMEDRINYQVRKLWLRQYKLHRQADALSLPPPQMVPTSPVQGYSISSRFARHVEDAVTLEVQSCA